ncbi:MAG: RNA pseudouridine synthase, partial [Candidatus Aminicenantales bacterium]
MKNNGYDYPDRIPASDSGVTVLAFYARRYPHSTEAEWADKIKRGQVSLNGHPAESDTVLARGDLLNSSRPSWDEPDAPTDFGVLFEDENALVL